MFTEDIIIDKEFEQLIPPLTEEEYKGLEASILAEGCRDPLVTWHVIGEILIDGHNRYKICTKHNIPFTTVSKDFASRDEVLLWIMRNQLSRRNLSDIQRVELVRRCEDAVKSQAKKRQISGLVHQEDTVVENLLQRDETEHTGKKSRDELGAMAGVSGKTYEHATDVLDNASASVVNAVRNKELSINSAYEVTKMPQEEQAEITERIEQGENPKKVVSEIKKRGKTRKVNSQNDVHEQETEIEIETHSEKYNVISLNLGTDYSHATLAKLPVKKLAEEDCALFLWCRYDMLQDVFKSPIWEKWGFKYRTVAFLLMKSDIERELCILATRGNFVLNDSSLPKVIDNISGKEFKDFIQELVGDIQVFELS